jgi:hypothetical protein
MQILDILKMLLLLIKHRAITHEEPQYSHDLPTFPLTLVDGT